VLLDELGTSTDPEEGSALARAILLHFLSCGTMTVATTHYGELKAFAHATSGMQNASFGFDPVTLAPTYHLVLGIPGGSNALVTASRLGLPQDIISSAKGMLSNSTQELDALLGDLVNEKRQAETLRQGLEGDRAEVGRLRDELSSELQRLKVEGQKAIQETRDRVLLDAAKLLKQLRQASAELAKKVSKERLERAKQAVTHVQEQLQRDRWQVGSAEKASLEISADSIAAGDTVWLREADLQATVLSVSDETGQVELQAGSTKLSLNIDSVEKVLPSPDSTKGNSISVRKKLSRRIVPEELDLRGKRADEVEPVLDRYINDASLAGLGQVRITHGIGTGTVRDIVREVLGTHPLVKSFRAGRMDEGGDGVTFVVL
jgi:DNA mismatch repair protein MutS2